jgi:hypothetical protein
MPATCSSSGVDAQQHMIIVTDEAQ